MGVSEQVTTQAAQYVLALPIYAYKKIGLYRSILH